MAKPGKVDISRRVRKRRTILTLTQAELAQELDVTPQHISRIEAGDAVPSLDLLIRLSSRLGVSTDYLLTGHAPAPLDITAAIRADEHLTPTAKRHLIGITNELHNNRPTRRST